MSGTAKKVLIFLITIVICVLIGAFAINTLVPNGVNGLINAMEVQIKNATGMELDFNGDGVGSSNTVNTGAQSDDQMEGGGVTGFNP